MQQFITITHKATSLQVITYQDIEKARQSVFNYMDHSKGIYHISPMINKRSVETFRYEIKKAVHDYRVEKETITPDKLITAIGANPLYKAWIIALLDEQYKERLHKYYNRTFVNDTYELTPDYQGKHKRLSKQVAIKPAQSIPG